MSRRNETELVTVERWRVEQLGDELEDVVRYLLHRLDAPWDELAYNLSGLENHHAVHKLRRTIVDQVLAAAETVATVNLLDESRAPCPLCGATPQSPYDLGGFKLPLGLERHLYGSSAQECYIMRVWQRYAHRYVNHKLGRPLWSSFSDL